MDQILEAKAKGDLECQLNMMNTIIVSITVERFRTEAPKPIQSAYARNHRARKIQHLREELKLLKRQYKTAGEVERAGPADLRAILRKQLLTLQRAEFHRRRQKETARKRASFLANPLKLTKQFLLWPGSNPNPARRGLAVSPAQRRLSTTTSRPRTVNPAENNR